MLRFPNIPFEDLTRMFEENAFSRHIVLDHYFKKVKLNLELLNFLDIINRTSELARVFGIEFFSVMSRGSQYRVEGMMIRLTKPRNYVALSPLKQQVVNQNAIECLPLVMEPQSRMYTKYV